MSPSPGSSDSFFGCGLFGCFGFARSDDAFRHSIDKALATYLGSREHRAMMHGFGFTDAEIALAAPAKR